MKCAICGKKTNWDSSFGKENFIICNECFQELYNKSNLPKVDRVFNILDTIFSISDIKSLDK